MARKTYGLSDETFKVLSGHESEIAREMNCDPSYIFKIKSGAETDHYPRFREIFRSASYTNTAPVEIWLNELSGIYIRSRGINSNTAELSVKILEKIESDSKSLKAIVKGLRDGKLDKSECHEILSKLAKNKATNTEIEELIRAYLGGLEEK